MAGNGKVIRKDSHALKSLTNLDERADAIIERIPEMGDDELLDARRDVILAGKACWRIEIALDYEIRQRLHARRGRGNVDSEGIGVKATLAERAEQLGVNPRTLQRNAQIYRTFFVEQDVEQNGVGAHTILEAVDVLKDKTFLEEALRADDPQAELLRLAERKRQDPLFSTREARRGIEEADAPGLDHVIESSLSPEARAAWDAYRHAAGTLKFHLPALRQILSLAQEEMEWELSRPAQAISDRIIALIRDGFDTVDTLASMVKLSRVHCQVVLRHLEDQGKVTAQEMERAPGARGAAKTQYFATDRKTK